MLKILSLHLLVKAGSVMDQTVVWRNVENLKTRLINILPVVFMTFPCPLHK